MFVLMKVIKGYYVLTYRLLVTFLNAGFIDTWLLLIYDFSAFRLFESLLQFSDFFCIEKNDHKPEGQLICQEMRFLCCTSVLNINQMSPILIRIEISHGSHSLYDSLTLVTLCMLHSIFECRLVSNVYENKNISCKLWLP